MDNSNNRAPAEADSTGSPVKYECHGKVALVSYDRPARRNAWSVACVEATVAAIQRANADPAINAIVLTGEGGTYCAGADLKDERRVDPDSGRRLTPATFTMGKGERNWIHLLAHSKPTVVAVNGPAVGIGATHILAADIRIAAESASFSFPFLRLGAMPECGSTALLPRLVGAGRAMDLLLRNATVSAQEALHLGLVTAVHPDAALRAEALALAAQIAELPPLQVGLTRRMLRDNAQAGTAEAVMRTENAAFVELLQAVKREKPL